MTISNVILSGRRGKPGLSLLVLQALLPVQKAQVAQKGTVVKGIWNLDFDIEDDKNNKRSSKQYHARGEQKLKSVVGKKPVHTNPLLNAMVNNL